MAMGVHTAVTAQEEAKATPDRQIIAHAGAGRCDRVRRGETLDATNTEEVAQVRAESSALIRRARDARS
ncbi:hypothetical protein J4H86_05250 [Spiractinospora alimapuensis]|uniref:hypothetical protein n=1 Tax=Spiractinospora alimapuensis TaxID=2820884 RepID=UPI001F47B933|nr:hypothetical protein [Spiractinospora alimapuensis]QVQ53191.1 hypothetical protein J4H86_05250 [Spiractinospora alimapuensis]